MPLTASANTPREIAKQDALEKLRKAAENGDADAMYELGYMYHFGKGVPQNHHKADSWYRKAAGWYRKAAEKGDAHAMYKLGGMYVSGRGVSQDSF